MSRYLFTSSARRDLIGIWEWIVEDNTDAADRGSTARGYKSRISAVLRSYVRSRREEA